MKGNFGPFIMESKSKMGLCTEYQLSSFGVASILAISGCTVITDSLKRSDRLPLVKGTPLRVLHSDLAGEQRAPANFRVPLNQQIPIGNGSPFSIHFGLQEQFCLFFDWFQCWHIYYVIQSPFIPFSISENPVYSLRNSTPNECEKLECKRNWELETLAYVWIFIFYFYSWILMYRKRPRQDQDRTGIKRKENGRRHPERDFFCF